MFLFLEAHLRGLCIWSYRHRCRTDKPSVPNVNKAVLPLPMHLYGMVHNLTQGQLYVYFLLA
jgi:hypothetical protein